MTVKACCSVHESWVPPAATLVLAALLLNLALGAPRALAQQPAGEATAGAGETPGDSAGEQEPEPVAPAGDLVASAMPEDEELEALMQVLEDETEIATRTRMNSDFVPGTVSVVHAEQLEATGARTVADALARLPGVVELYDGNGSPLITVRGVPFAFNSGNIKLMLDGVPLSRQVSAVNSSLLQLPIELVERLEFVRGPGATLHGDFAFLGLLNIVTRRNQRRAFAGASDRQAFAGGLNFGWADGGGKHQFGGSIAGSGGGDALAAEGVEADDSRLAATAWWQSGGLGASAYLLTRDRDQFSDETFSRVRERSWAVQAHHAATPSPKLETRVRALFLYNDFEFPDILFEGGQFITEASLTWKGLPRNTWLLALDYTDSSLDEATRFPPQRPGGPTPGPEVTPPGTHRRSFSVGLQDQIDLGDAVSVTLGARYQTFDDGLASQFSPRAAVVWRLSDEHILKGQYAEGFRAPNFFEQYGTGEAVEGLEPETVQTAELSYVYRVPRAVGRLSVFYSDMDDLIFRGRPGGGSTGPPMFANMDEAEAWGAEIEWEQQISRLVRLAAQASYVNPEDSRALTENPSAYWSGDLSLIVQPFDGLLLGGHWYHVGERGFEAGTVEGFDLVDLTASVPDLLLRGLTLRAGVRDVLDEGVTNYRTVIAGPFQVTRFPTRMLWAQVSYSF